MRLRSGQSAAALLPARYAGSELSDDSAVRLGRATAWVEDAGGERPVGQRLWTTNAGDDFGLLSLRRLDFA
jgi:type VI secretion system protein ImpE